MGILDGPLADTVFNAFRGKLKTGVLRITAHPISGALDGRGDPTEAAPTDYPIEGFTSRYSDYARAQLGIPDTDLKVSIFAKSLPAGIEPAKDSKVRIGNQWHQIRRLSIDPAGALWVCQSFEIEDPA